jgi:hypothetical protein
MRDLMVEVEPRIRIGQSKLLAEVARQYRASEKHTYYQQSVEKVDWIRDVRVCKTSNC